MFYDIPTLDYAISAFYAAPYSIETSVNDSPFLTKDDLEKQKEEFYIKYDEFKDKVLWKRIDTDWFPRKWKYQCVDPIKEYIEFLWFNITPTWNAIDYAGEWKLWEDFTYTEYNWTNKPDKWDILIYWKSFWKYWHIVLVSECIDKENCKILEQNWANWYWNWKNWDQVTERSRTLYWAVGWQSPKAY